MKIDGSRVLVTGGAGLIGSHLADELVRLGCQVTVLDNLDPQTHPNGKPDWIHPKTRFLHGDVRRYADLKTALKGCDFVFHQAAFGGFTDELSLYMDSNSTGTARIFEVIVREKIPVKKVIVASSQAVYGEGLYRCETHGEFSPPMRGIRQLKHRIWEHLCPRCDSPMRPLRVGEEKSVQCETIYGISKYAEERITIGLGKRFGIPTVAMRYAVTFGPRQSIFNPYTGIVSIFSMQLLNEQAPVIFEDGEQTRDMLSVRDNVSANVFLAEHEGADYEVYNVATGRAVRVREVVELLAEKYGKHICANTPGEFRLGDVRHFVHDPSKIGALGWQSRYSLSESLDEYVTWIKSQRDLKNYFAMAHRRMRETRLVMTSD